MLAIDLDPQGNLSDYFDVDPEASPTVGDVRIRRPKRRVPVDPMTGKAEWGMRCYQDDADDTSWCGQNVYDVYTTSGGTALDA